MGVKKNKSKRSHPVLIVDNLPKSFGSIKKNDTNKKSNITENERILLTLLAGIMIEIILNEEL